MSKFTFASRAGGKRRRMDPTRITPQTPATPELEPDEATAIPAAQSRAQRPDLKEPPPSMDTDAEALEKGIDVLERVKPY